MSSIKLEDWGLIDYEQAYQRQKDIVQEVLKGGCERLVFCEHPAVLTLGRMTKQESLLYTKEEIIQKGVGVYSIDRGGDITLHAQGQLIVYPILDLNNFGRDLKDFMQKLEQVAVDFLKDFGILAISIPGKRGVFVSRDKIISMGIGVKKWVCFHGVGINVNTDLNLFLLIKPCGLDVQMTSIQKQLGRQISMDQVKISWINHFQRVFKVGIES